MQAFNNPEYKSKYVVVNFHFATKQYQFSFLIMKLGNPIKTSLTNIG